jgi:hypothetical protein
LREPMQAVAHEVGKHVPFVAAVAGDPAGAAPREPHSSPVLHDEGLRRRKNGTAAGGGMADEEDPALRDFDPEKYQRYKKKLKVALMEYYKELEILKNFRVRRRVRGRGDERLIPRVDLESNRVQKGTEKV